MSFEFDFDFDELPPRPPRLPRPKPWRTIFAVVWDLGFAIWLYPQSPRVCVFISGLLVAFAIYQAAEYAKLVLQGRRLQAEMDSTYDDMIDHVRTLAKLVERHGPDDAIEIMRTADNLLSEGDFPTLRQAVAAIERHHDMEPTNYDE
jgi:hypothetical protein